MTKRFFTGKGSVINLGSMLGKGGEGTVYEVPTNSMQVAKLYHRVPDARKQSKLRFMATMPNEKLLSYSAWPLETLHETINGQVVGFLMPKVTGREAIHILYSPAHRRQEYPRAAWDFLLLAARNTAAAFNTLHDQGHIVGDVNQGNVVVGSDSKVQLIDCDSYQINANGNLHLCEVGVSHFTPPELQGLNSFKGLKRSFNHDNFGLALLIFHILFGGRHPYSGVPLRKNIGEALETDIKAFRFAYSRDAQSRGIEPPPKSIPISIVPDPIEAMFTLAFTERGALGGRPSGLQWISALDALRRSLKKCNHSSMHIYPDHLPRCPWCLLEDKGIVYFIDFGFYNKTTETGFNLNRIWVAIEAVPVPSPLNIPNVKAISVKPAPLPPGVISILVVIFLRILVVCGVIGMFFVVPNYWFFICFGGCVTWGLAGSVGESGRQAEKTKRREKLDKALKEYETIETRFRMECGPEGFLSKKQEFARLRDEYKVLPDKENNEIKKLYSTAEARQKKQFLERCFIDSANISGVGPSRKAALRSFGIETAADISTGKVRSVRGFGEALTRAVVDWKKSCERRFVYKPQNAVSEADKNAVRVKMAARKRIIEAVLSSGAKELQKFRQESSRKSKTLYPLLENAANKLAQAQTDFGFL